MYSLWYHGSMTHFPISFPLHSLFCYIPGEVLHLSLHNGAEMLRFCNPELLGRHWISFTLQKMQYLYLARAQIIEVNTMSADWSICHIDLLGKMLPIAVWGRQSTLQEESCFKMLPPSPQCHAITATSVPPRPVQPQLCQKGPQRKVLAHSTLNSPLSSWEILPGTVQGSFL